MRVGWIVKKVGKAPYICMMLCTYRFGKSFEWSGLRFLQSSLHEICGLRKVAVPSRLSRGKSELAADRQPKVNKARRVSFAHEQEARVLFSLIRHLVQTQDTDNVGVL